MRRFASALASLALATFASAPALADCIPGTGLCASVGVGLGLPAVQAGGQITVSVPPIVFPFPVPGVPGAQPPPVPMYQPPPPVIVYQQPPPRPMYYAPPPPPVYWGASRLGLDLRIDGAAGLRGDKANSVFGLGGAGIGLRYRAAPHLGLEVGVDVLGGRDYNRNKRVEVAGTLGGLVYLNPRSRAQLYLSGGLLVDHADATDDHTPRPINLSLTTDPFERDYTHVGGYAGLGLETFITRRIAFHVDARGFMRQRVGGGAGSAPEFTNPTTGRTTNTSGGVVGSAGVIFYF